MIRGETQCVSSRQGVSRCRAPVSTYAESPSSKHLGLLLSPWMLLTCMLHFEMLGRQTQYPNQMFGIVLQLGYRPHWSHSEQTCPTRSTLLSCDAALSLDSNNRSAMPFHNLTTLHYYACRRLLLTKR